MPSMQALSQVRWSTALAGLAVWATTVPWLAEAVGLELDVSPRLEIVDHVIPGVVMLAAAALLAARGGPRGSLVWLGVAAIAFLTGFWISTGPPIMLLGLWLLLRGPSSDNAART